MEEDLRGITWTRQFNLFGEGPTEAAEDLLCVNVTRQFNFINLSIFIWQEYLEKNENFNIKDTRFYIFEMENGLKECTKDEFREWMKDCYLTKTKAKFLRYLDNYIFKTSNVKVVIWFKSNKKNLMSTDSIKVEDVDYEICGVFDYIL